MQTVLITEWRGAWAGEKSKKSFLFYVQVQVPVLLQYSYVLQSHQWTSYITHNLMFVVRSNTLYTSPPVGSSRVFRLCISDQIGVFSTLGP